MPKFEDYEIVRQLKSGQNCRTFLVKLKRTGELYVMKRVQLNAGDKGSVEEHINAMKQYEPRFITKLICTAINEKEFYRIYEYYPKGDLHKVISDLHHLTQEERLNRVWEIFSYIVRSLDNLHSQGFSHFNLKPQNILVLEDGSVRLDDFIVGSDIQVKDYYTKVEGSKIYMAPEVLSLKKIDSTSDIFSLSVIIAELLIGHHPFIGKNDKDTIEKIQKSQFELLPDWIDSELKEILLQMIDIDSDKRPTTSTILQTEKIKDILQRFDENEDITETSEEKVKQMKTEFCSLKQTTMISYNLVKKLELGLETSRYIRCGKVKKMTFDMYETAREINEICSTIVFNVIQIEEDVELADQTNLIHEIVDLVKNVTLDDITHDMVNAIEKISNFGSAQLNHKIFEMGLIQSLVPNIKYYNREMQQGLILTFSHIIRKGWKQPRLSSLTELQTQQKLTSGSEPSSTTSSSLQMQPLSSLQKWLKSSQPIHSQLQSSQSSQYQVHALQYQPEPYSNQYSPSSQQQYSPSSQQQQSPSSLYQYPVSNNSSPQQVHQYKYQYDNINSGSSTALHTSTSVTSTTSIYVPTSSSNTLYSSQSDSSSTSSSTMFIQPLFQFTTTSDDLQRMQLLVSENEHQPQLPTIPSSLSSLQQLQSDTEQISSSSSPQPEQQYDDEQQQLQTSSQQLLQVYPVPQYKQSFPITPPHSQHSSPSQQSISQLSQQLSQTSQNDIQSSELSTSQQQLYFQQQQNQQLQDNESDQQQPLPKQQSLQRSPLTSSASSSQYQSHSQLILSSQQRNMSHSFTLSQLSPLFTPKQVTSSLSSQPSSSSSTSSSTSVQSKFLSPLASTQQQSQLQQSASLTQLINLQPQQYLQLSSQFTSPMQNPLHKLIHIRHPYRATLAREEMIKIITEDMLTSEEVDMSTKILVYKFFDILYTDGFRIPSDLQSSTFASLSTQTKSGSWSDQKQSLECLAYLALNKGNHDAILGTIAMEVAARYIRYKAEDTYVDPDKFANSIRLIQNLFAFGTQQTQQLVRQQVTNDKLQNLTKDNDLDINQKAKRLLSVYEDPEEMKVLILIKRVVQRRNEEGFIDLIKVGLLNLINEKIENGVYQNDGEGKMIYLEEILRLLIIDNPEVSRVIVNETNFIDQLIMIFHELPPTSHKTWKIQPLNFLSEYLPNDLKIRMFEKGIVQTMLKLLNSRNRQAQLDSGRVITNIINSGLEGIKQGEKHLFYQQLSEDGTLKKLQSWMNDDSKREIQSQIAKILAQLYKSIALPQEIKKKVIEQLKDKKFPDLDGLAYLAENQDNHEEILADDYGQKLFENKAKTTGSLQLTSNLIQFGSEMTKKSIIMCSKDNVKQLTDDSYLQQLGQSQGWNKEKLKGIKDKANQILLMINVKEPGCAKCNIL